MKKNFNFKNLPNELPQLIILVLIVILSSIFNPDFRTANNLINILRQASLIGIISCGMTLLLISGSLDLSVGSAFSLINVIAISMQRKSNILGIVIPIAVAIILGLFNGLIVTKFNINSIIVTLGSLSLFAGIANIYTNGSIIQGTPDTWYSVIGKSNLLGIPIYVIIFVIIAIIYHLLLSRTTFGRKIIYTGTNQEAAKIIGIKVGSIRTICFIISSVSVAIAVIIYSSRMVTAQPTTGVGLEFTAVTAIVIGGTSLIGGKGSIARTIIGVFILTVIINVLTLYNVQFAYQNVIKGFLILLAIFIDFKARKRIVV
jgi:ribose/xylose/arabinose/galactoside ABC-type transport system permease subunit